MNQTVADTGTQERAWAAWRGLAKLPELPLGDCPAALVVAPHPDDEVLGVGGTIVQLRALGVEVSILALTDGEASHPGAPLAAAELAARRAAESERALRALGGGAEITRVRLPDGALASCEPLIEQAVGERLIPGSWCFAPFLRDGHPDHEATARACARACERHGALLVEYPIWLWHWTLPGVPGVPWQRARRISLSPGARTRKARAIGEFASQIGPVWDGPGGAAILPPQVLEHFQRPFEVVFT